MFPFERFTDRARRVLVLAQEEAARKNHSYIGTEHLLLALLREEEGLGGRVLRGLGVDLATVRSTIESVLGRNERIRLKQSIPTGRVRTVIEIAFEEAQRVGSSRVGTEHILLGLMIEGEGIAAHVLEDLGASRERVFQRVAELTGTPPATGRGSPHSRSTAPRAVHEPGETAPRVSREVVDVLNAAADFAREEGAPEITPEHVRRALERPDPPAEETRGS